MKASNPIYIMLLIVYLLIASDAAAQPQYNLDSLKSVYNNKSLPDTSRIRAVGTIALGIFMRSNPDSAIYYAQLQNWLAAKTNNPQSQADALHTMGMAYYFTSQWGKSIDALKESLELRGDNGDKSAQAATLNVIGAVYMEQGNHAQAMIHYIKCLQISEELKDKRGIAGSTFNIGRIYSHRGEYQKALEFFDKSLENRDKNDLIGIANVLDVIATCYADLGKKLKALEYFNRVLEMRTQIGDTLSIAMSYNNLGLYYLKENLPDSALPYMETGLSLFTAINDQIGISTSYLSFGNAYKLKGQCNKAIDYSTKGLQIAQQIESAKLIQENAQLLSECYKSMGNIKEAFAMYELYMLMRDSITSEQNQQEVLRQEYKYEYEKEALTDSLEFAKKEALMIEQTKRQQIGLLATGGGILLLISLVFAIYKGKKRSDELLLNILPEETAAELKKKGYAEARQFEQVTVLFTDFKDFTPKAEKLSPTQLVAEINECFKAFDEIIEKNGIEKIKTIGDAYMAAGGLPTPDANNPVSTIKAALEIRDWMLEYKKNKGENAFEIRIGVHTGPVVAGIVGIKKFQYDIWGDTVNTASRMESNGAVGKVNISEATYQLVKDQFKCEPRGKISVKGKGEVEMFFVEA